MNDDESKGETDEDIVEEEDGDDADTEGVDTDNSDD